MKELIPILAVTIISQPMLPSDLCAQTGSTADVTTTHRRNHEIAAAEFAPVFESLRQLIEVDLVELQSRLDVAGVPWTPGRRLPGWSM